MGTGEGGWGIHISLIGEWWGGDSHWGIGGESD